MSRTAIVTGSSGLVGSSAARRLVAEGFHVVGLDNDMRRHFFGPEASTLPVRRELERELNDHFLPLSVDIRRKDQVGDTFNTVGEIEIVVDCFTVDAILKSLVIDINGHDEIRAFAGCFAVQRIVGT